MKVQRVLWGVALLMVVCVFYRYMRKETFAAGKTPADILSNVKSLNSELTDNLNINTYRSQYEALILELDTWADLTMLNMLTTNVTTSQASIAQFNALSEFKKTMNDTMTYLDNH